MVTLVRDGAALVGLGLLAAGCWQAWAPLGLIVPGGLILAAAVWGQVRDAGGGDAAE